MTGLASQKMRALQQATGMDLKTVAETYFPRPATYSEIAREWTVVVRRECPELDLRFDFREVGRVFKAHGLMRVGPHRDRKVVSA